MRVLRKRPEQPTAAEVKEQTISVHEPYRSWCRACVAGRGRADAHVVRPGVEKGVPIIGVDHGYLWSRAPETSDAPQDDVAGEDPPDGVRTSSPVLCGRCSVDRWLFGRNGFAEGAVKILKAKIRTLRHSTEMGLGRRIPETHDSLA